MKTEMLRSLQEELSQKDAQLQDLQKLLTQKDTDSQSLQQALAQRDQYITQMAEQYKQMNEQYTQVVQQAQTLASENLGLKQKVEKSQSPVESQEAWSESQPTMQSTGEHSESASPDVRMVELQQALTQRDQYIAQVCKMGNIPPEKKSGGGDGGYGM